jgi:hypothetical protein
MTEFGSSGVAYTSSVMLNRDPATSMHRTNIMRVSPPRRNRRQLMNQMNDVATGDVPLDRGRATSGLFTPLWNKDLPAEVACEGLQLCFLRRTSHSTPTAPNGVSIWVNIKETTWRISQRLTFGKTVNYLVGTEGSCATNTPNLAKDAVGPDAGPLHL